MEPLFSLEHCYIIQTDQPIKWLAVYHQNGNLYSLGIRAEKFNHARDSVRKEYSDAVGLVASDMIALTELNRVTALSHAVKDIFRVTNGVRVTPSYTERHIFIKPSDGYSPEEILQMDDATVKAAQRAAVTTPFTVHKGTITAQSDGTIELEYKPVTVVTEATIRAISDTQLGEALKEDLLADMEFNLEDYVDPLADQVAKYPAYWKPLPKNWRAIDTYRVDILFPLNDSRLTHARKKLLVPGTRTGNKSFRKDILEAWATLGQWLLENPDE